MIFFFVQISVPKDIHGVSFSLFSLPVHIFSILGGNIRCCLKENFIWFRYIRLQQKILVRVLTQPKTFNFMVRSQISRKLQKTNKRGSPCFPYTVKKVIPLIYISWEHTVETVDLYNRYFIEQKLKPKRTPALCDRTLKILNSK